MVTTANTFFFESTINSDENSQNSAEFNKINLIILEETKKNGNTVVQISENKIKFSSNNTYTFVKDDGAIYKNKVRICDNIEKCKFEKELINGKEILSVELKIGDLEQTMEYVVSSAEVNAFELNNDEESYK